MKNFLRVKHLKIGAYYFEPTSQRYYCVTEISPNEIKYNIAHADWPSSCSGGQYRLGPGYLWRHKLNWRLITRSERLKVLMLF